MRGNIARLREVFRKEGVTERNALWDRRRDQIAPHSRQLPRQPARHERASRGRAVFVHIAHVQNDTIYRGELIQCRSDDSLFLVVEAREIEAQVVGQRENNMRGLVGGS